MIVEKAIKAAAKAIKAAQCPGREGPFGHYDYSSYGWDKPHRVRDFRDPSSKTWGHDVFKSDSREESWAEYERLTEEHIARAALSAALPVMLEGKREEIARVIDPDGYWERLDSCNHALATVQMNDDQRHALTKVRDDELRCTAESLAKADRIIAMLGGGE